MKGEPGTGRHPACSAHAGERKPIAPCVRETARGRAAAAKPAPRSASSVVNGDGSGHADRHPVLGLSRVRRDRPCARQGGQRRLPHGRDGGAGLGGRVRCPDCGHLPGLVHGPAGSAQEGRARCGPRDPHRPARQPHSPPGPRAEASQPPGLAGFALHCHRGSDAMTAGSPWLGVRASPADCRDALSQQLPDRSRSWCGRLRGPCPVPLGRPASVQAPPARSGDLSCGKRSGASVPHGPSPARV